ncbi:MAG TPA: CoA-binding protein, partial [Candidatus Nitrosocosmicus sp.]|nr:CoA-binding protein [Candidatus Nitrosocosmicus sp.]
MLEKNDLTSLFNPKSVSIIGASQDTKKVGYIVLKNIIEAGFKGNIYPVNLSGEIIQGIQSFKSYEELPEKPDLALIAIPSTHVIETIEQIGKKGTKNIVVFSAGFKEIGEEGKILEDKIISLSNQYDLNVIGPNCLGFVNNRANLNATFAQVAKKIGSLHFIS